MIPNCIICGKRQTNFIITMTNKTYEEPTGMINGKLYVTMFKREGDNPLKKLKVLNIDLRKGDWNNTFENPITKPGTQMINEEKPNICLNCLKIVINEMIDNAISDDKMREALGDII